MKKLMAFLFLSLTMAGCTTLGEKFVAKTDLDRSKATVYVYRVSRFVGSAFSPDLMMDGKKVADLANGGYSVLEVAPGQHKFGVMLVMSNTEVGTITANLEKGKEYYLRYDVSMFNGVGESIAAGNQAGLAGAGIQGGGGAIGGAMTGAASGLFLSDKEQSTAMLGNVDKRAQARSANPGFLFVNPKIAKAEIVDTKFRKFTPPKK